VLVLPWSHILFGSLIGPAVGLVALVIVGELRFSSSPPFTEPNPDNERSKSPASPPSPRC